MGYLTDEEKRQDDTEAGHEVEGEVGPVPLQRLVLGVLRNLLVHAVQLPFIYFVCHLASLAAGAWTSGGARRRRHRGGGGANAAGLDICCRRCFREQSGHGRRGGRGGRGGRAAGGGRRGAGAAGD